MPAPTYAVVICTRNRPDAVTRLLRSLAHEAEPGMHVWLVDASDAADRRRNAAAVEAFTAAPIHHLLYSGTPSLARQRNFALDALPETIVIVHFLDDDVTVHPGYFRALNTVFAEEPAVGGSGGRILQDGTDTQRRGLWWRRLFLLDHPVPGRVLCSGATTPAQVLPLTARTPVSWLSGCSCAFRRVLLDRHRFDPALEGYSLDEDLDFSYRVGREARLVVVPEAVLTHHVAPGGRESVDCLAHDALVHRYWFLEKNLRSRWRKPAFWWSVVGRLLAAGISRSPQARNVFRARLRAVGTIWRRAHSLLRPWPRP
ncbi:MAG: hypothetical protein KatS3mg043_1781 [Rhodothermaceae bacterium]|nr:MAG: hypothetical protein KatS3mg043_1781 [Rhodothermaceae bacterium]